MSKGSLEAGPTLFLSLPDSWEGTPSRIIIFLPWGVLRQPILSSYCPTDWFKIALWILLDKNGMYSVVIIWLGWGLVEVRLSSADESSLPLQARDVRSSLVSTLFVYSHG